MKTALSVFCAAAAVSGLLNPLAAQQAASDWPQFRGPQVNPVGKDPRLPDKWNKSTNVEWAQKIPGRGWSSPIVVGSRVFVTTVVTDGKSKLPQAGTEYSNQYVAELAKQGLSEAEITRKVMERDFELPNEVFLHYFLYALDLKTGSVVWKKEFHTGRPPGGRHRKNSFTSETPVSDGRRVYVYVGNLGLWAFDLNGNQVWKTPIEANPIYLEFGTGGSPVLAGSNVVVLCDNQKQQYIAAYDRDTGRRKWITNRNLGTTQMRSSWATPYVWTHSQRTEIVTVGPEVAVSYDLNGKELWRMSGMSPAPIPSPFAYEGLLYINGGRGRPLYAVKPGASGDISLPRGETAGAFVAWSQPRGGTYLPSPLAYDGGIYVLTENGILSRFEAKTGKQTYRERLEGGGNYTTSPWAYNGKVFCLSEEGVTHVVTAGETFRVLHTNALEEMAQSTPAIAADRLLIRTETVLYSFKTSAVSSGSRSAQKRALE
jgi:outer membrane protein assembly factor BamB